MIRTNKNKYLIKKRTITPSRISLASALNCLKKGNYEEAIKYYNLYLEKISNDSDKYYQRGYCYFNLKNLKKAKEDLNKAIELNKSNKEAKDLLKAIEEKEKIKKPKLNRVTKTKIGFLTFADILGWKGIWQRDKDPDSKINNINKLKNIKDNLIYLSENYSTKGIRISINLISDTFIIESSNLEIHNKLCKELVKQCLENDLLIRGATAYGEYLDKDMIYIGEAVDEAASWHELAEEVSIFYTISARLKLEEIMENMNEEEKKEYLKNIELINSEVQLKKGKMDTYLISWIDDEENRAQFKEIMKKEIIYPELALKYLNTEKQINNFLKNNQ